MNNLAVAAEQHFPRHEASAPRPLPQLYLVPPSTETEVRRARDAEHEVFVQAQYRHWLGSVAVVAAGSDTRAERTSGQTNLLQTVREARNGSAEALNRLDMSIDTATNEAMFKWDYVGRRIATRPDEFGNLWQFGQSMESVHANALALRPNRPAILKDITRKEALGGIRIANEYRTGSLQDNYYVTFSVVPGGVSAADLGSEGDGYFLDSLTLAIQITTEEADGTVTTEPIFMAGVEANDNDSFEDKLAKRTDIKAIGMIYESFGLPAPNTAAELLDNALIIPKQRMPQRGLDVMRWVHQATDKILGRPPTHGGADYRAIVEDSRLREASLADVKLKIRQDLLQSANHLRTAMDAVQLLWELVKHHTLNDAMTNYHINPKVFGAAAESINRARLLLQDGNLLAAQNYILLAEELAEITGCGGGSAAANADKEAADAEANKPGNDKYGSKIFKCKKGHFNIRPHGELVECCQICGDSVRC